MALAALCLHVWHGVWSALQTLGAIRGNVIPFVRLIAFIVAFGLFLAFMCVPTAILLGLTPEPMDAAKYAVEAANAGINWMGK